MSTIGFHTPDGGADADHRYEPVMLALAVGSIAAVGETMTRRENTLAAGLRLLGGDEHRSLAAGHPAWAGNCVENIKIRA